MARKLKTSEIYAPNGVTEPTQWEIYLPNGEYIGNVEGANAEEARTNAERDFGSEVDGHSLTAVPVPDDPPV